MPERFFWLSLIVVVLLAAVVIGMIISFRRRSRRQAELDESTPVPPAAELGAPLDDQEALLVATTRAGDPYDRVVVGGLGFRARGTVTVHPGGVLLSLDGGLRRFVPADRIRGVGRATWTIDRTVEPDGFVLLGWRLGDGEVESYLRVDDPSALVRAVSSIAPAVAAAPTAPPTSPLPSPRPVTPSPLEETP